MVAGFGTLEATDNGDGTFTATSGNGYYNGDPIELIANTTLDGSHATSPSGYFYFDDKIFGDPLGVNVAGLLFSIGETVPGSPDELNI